MIRISEDVFLYGEEDLNVFLEYMKAEALTQDEKDYHNVFSKYIKEVFQNDQKLQQMVSEKISDDLVSVVMLPIQEGEDPDQFTFGLMRPNGEKIKKKEELFYKNLCDICFGNTPGLYSTAVIEYSKSQQ